MFVIETGGGVAGGEMRATTVLPMPSHGASHNPFPTMMATIPDFLIGLYGESCPVFSRLRPE